MISLETKPDTKASSPLSLSVSKEEPTISFSELLNGIKDSKNPKDEKGIQNGSFVLSLGAEDKDDTKLSKTDALNALLKNDPKDIDTDLEIVDLKLADKGKIPLELNPKIAQVLTIAEVKELVANAKSFLKDKILNSQEYKMAQVKELPKTLKGLAEMAKSFGINLSKITFEEVKPTKAIETLSKNDKLENEIEVKPILRKEIVDDSKKVNVLESKLSQALEAKKGDKKVLDDTKASQNKPENKIEVKQENKVEVKQNHKTEVKTEQKVELSKVQQDDTKEEKIKVVSDEKSKHEIVDEPEIKVKIKVDKTAKIQNTQDTNQELRTKEDIKETVRENVKTDDKRVDVLNKLKTTPLFKAQDKVDHTTEQIVQTKQVKIENKSQKSRADETLKLLLRGEKPAMSINENMTKDFSVATARVIAPQATTEASKTMEQLLHGDADDSAAKLDGLTTHKSDSFEVKLNEAKQMIKYLSQDVKTAIEDYKSPFTRVKVQLNPAKMGEVDVTVVQRGKNLHVNISSNTAAINTLAINANELKAQLNTNGINNASLNFNNEQQNSEQNSHQQQNRRNEREAQEEYNYFENEEQNEEVLSSLEIVVPQYG